MTNRLAPTLWGYFLFIACQMAPWRVGAQQAASQVVLYNAAVRAVIQLKGAELSSLYSLNDSLEYLWQADPAYWPAHAPILFPIIGSLKQDTYRYQGSTYTMPQHGFARNLDFTALHTSPSKAIFSLISDSTTFQRYPFEFELQVHYTLEGATLRVEYRVFNRDHKELFFSIGGHPGFNCPLREGEQRSDYALVFDQKETASLHLKPGKLRSGERLPFLSDENSISITDDLFAAGALIFSDLKSTKVHLKKGAATLLTVDFAGFPNLGIWSSPGKDTPFVCIEPWFGLTDPVYTNQQLDTKEGIVRLGTRETFTCSYSITLHP